MDREDLCWLAGLLEGEGSFLRPMPSTPRMPSITVTMNDRDVIERAAALMGVGVSRRPPKGVRKERWQARVRGYPAASLMTDLRPLMGERRQGQIDRALDGYVARPKGTAKHGTPYMYRKGCRCDECRAAKHAEYVAATLA